MEKFQFEELLPKQGSVHIVVELGSVAVEVHESDQVLVTGRAQAVDISCRVKGDTVYVRAEPEERGVLSWLRAGKDRPKLEMTVFIPADCPVWLHTVTGQAEVDGVLAPVQARVTTGQMSLRDLGPVVNAEVTTGNLNYRGVLVEGQQRFQTTTGELHLALDKEPDAQIHARTTIGGLHCDFDLHDGRKKSNLTGSRLSGNLGSGAGQISAKVVTGNIHLEKVGIKNG